MDQDKVEIRVTINGVARVLRVGQNERLLEALRRASYFCVKRGCDTSDCGVCIVLLDASPVKSCEILAKAADGRTITTVEGLKPTVGRPPTLSAGRKILIAAKAAHYRRPQSFGDMVLTDRGLTTEIAQFELGNLTFKVHYPHYILLCSRQGIVGHLQHDFDTGAHLSVIYFDVTNVLLCLSVVYPVAPNDT